jgi:hypothetical protein
MVSFDPFQANQFELKKQDSILKIISEAVNIIEESGQKIPANNTAQTHPG